MSLMFYPHSEDAQKGSLSDRIDLLMDAAQRYKAMVSDLSARSAQEAPRANGERRMIPRDLEVAYNWEEIAIVLREIRELPEMNKADKDRKGDLLAKLSEIYEVLRAAKMSKLEAVRLALINEANQLRNSNV